VEVSKNRRAIVWDRWLRRLMHSYRRHSLIFAQFLRRLRVSSLTVGLPRSARDTVDCETPGTQRRSTGFGGHTQRVGDDRTASAEALVTGCGGSLRECRKW
jgi:hypothetical protein